jgi:putative redox protein
MHAIATWQGGFRTLLEDGRTHSIVVDLPFDEGGQSTGTSSLELAVLALAGCVTTVFAEIAERRQLTFQAMTVAVEANRPKGARTITRVRGTFRIRTGAPSSEVETALRLTLRICPVGVLFERAGIPVEINPIVEPSTLHHPASSAALT